MAIFGLILLVACGVVAAAFLVNNSDAADTSLIGIGSLHFTVAGLFLIGALVGLLFAIGLGLFFTGLARARRRAAERRRLARKSREGEGLREENVRLAAELEQTRAAQPTETAPIYPEATEQGAHPVAPGEHGGLSGGKRV
jgi:uncharacterized protein HemX